MTFLGVFTKAITQVTPTSCLTKMSLLGLPCGGYYARPPTPPMNRIGDPITRFQRIEVCGGAEVLIDRWMHLNSLIEVSWNRVENAPEVDREMLQNTDKHKPVQVLAPLPKIRRLLAMLQYLLRLYEIHLHRKAAHVRVADR